jgi:hypothetical protein
MGGEAETDCTLYLRFTLRRDKDWGPMVTEPYTGTIGVLDWVVPRLHNRERARGSRGRFGSAVLTGSFRELGKGSYV